MAAAAGAVGAWLNLVGPASTAFTQLIELSSKMPAVTNWFGWVDPDGQPGSVVNVGVGMFSGGDEDDFGGDGLKIAGFTAQGLFIGGGQAPHMNQGTTVGVALNNGKSEVPNTQAWQLTIRAGGSDAVCVQYVELAWQGTLTSGFDGTWGKDCGQDWYYSISTWGLVEGKNPNDPNGPPMKIPYRPACFWMDAGKDKSHDLTEIWVDMEKLLSGAPVTGSNSSAKSYCNDQVMKFSSKKGVNDNGPTIPNGLSVNKVGDGPGPGIEDPASSASNANPTYVPQQKRGRPYRGQPHMGRDKRQDFNPGGISATNTSTLILGTGSPTLSGGVTASNPPGFSAIATGSYKALDSQSRKQLVVSEIEGQSAEELCRHPKSRGPDFISRVEMVFCDMTTKTTHPLCEGSVQTDCFALDHAGQKIKKRGTEQGGNSDALHRSYGKVLSWSDKNGGS